MQETTFPNLFMNPDSVQTALYTHFGKALATTHPAVVPPGKI